MISIESTTFLEKILNNPYFADSKIISVFFILISISKLCIINSHRPVPIVRHIEYYRVRRIFNKLQLSSRLPSPIARLLPGSGKYQVLYTDYDNFCILWSCSNFGIAYTGIYFSIRTLPYYKLTLSSDVSFSDQIWVLGREREFELATRRVIYDALDQLGLGSDRLVLSRHKNCPALFK